MKWTSPKRNSSRSLTTSWRRSSRAKDILREGQGNKSSFIFVASCHINIIINICIKLSYKNNKKYMFVLHVSMCVCVWVWMLQLADLQTDNEDVQRSVQQLKKKCQKLTAELQDTKLHLEGLHSRNHDLEKKQRKSVSVCLFVCLFFFLSYTYSREPIAPFSLEGQAQTL